MTIKVGTVITAGTEEYSITSSISKGGFGETFLAERTKPEPLQVVIKVPLDDVLEDEVWSKKFAREARILANISHPNVVKILAYWEFPDGDKALVQELVAGAAELPAYLAATPSAAASAFLQTLYALRAFHGNGTTDAVHHRDLSPRNILVSNTGVVKVIDFGLAKEDPRATAVLTQKGEGFGTPGCMSPEQYEDAASVDHRTDLFALGRSFTAAILQRHPSVARCEKLPEPWKTLCMRLTEDAAGDRFQSASDALTEAMLQFAAANIPIEHFDFHRREMEHDPVDGWAQLCQSHFFAMADFDQATIRLMHTLDGSLFGAPFDANGMLDRLDACTAVKTVLTSSFVTFDDADPIGEVYARLYEHLDLTHKLACFQRLCGLAVRRHRYSVMQDVRNAYAAEKDPAIRAQLVPILDAEDPGRVIEGRGVLPRSP